jgi:hypothetical protein
LDPVLGVWHSADKLQEQTPWISPYAYAGNDPINNIDVAGLFVPKQREFAMPSVSELKRMMAGPGNFGCTFTQRPFEDDYQEARQNKYAPFLGSYEDFVAVIENRNNRQSTERNNRYIRFFKWDLHP